MHQGWALIIASLLLLTGCPTDKKRLRTGAEDVNASADSKENFNISFAYRDTTNPLNRVVQLQANYLLSSASLSTVCGNTGDNCTCDFYTSTTDTSPVGSSAFSLSTTSNVASCTVTGAVAIGSYTHALIRTTDSTKNSGLINISTTITAEQVLNDLDPNLVRKVFPYTCARSFLEGNGVSAGSISCMLTPNLGFLQATYTFYIYQGVDITDTNFSDKPTAVIPFVDYCNRSADPNVSCNNQSASPDFGLLKSPAGFYQTAVYLNSKPETNLGPPAKSLFGYAAVADSDGYCPPGLFGVRTWRADPPSITKNSLGSNPPSSFINSQGFLNDGILADAATAPSNFLIYRNPNSVACDNAANDCSNAQFAGWSLVVSTAYASQSPIICVLSPAVLSTL